MKFTDEEKREIGSRIRELRSSRGLSGEELGRAMGLSTGSAKTTVAKLEDGQVGTANIVAAARALECSVDYLLGLELPEEIEMEIFDAFNDIRLAIGEEEDEVNRRSVLEAIERAESKLRPLISPQRTAQAAPASTPITLPEKERRGLGIAKYTLSDSIAHEQRAVMDVAQDLLEMGSLLSRAALDRVWCKKHAGDLVPFASEVKQQKKAM